ncbi:MAG: hypothetical protein AAF696_11280 [Bacteroidota bacterium]
MKITSSLFSGFLIASLFLGLFTSCSSDIQEVKPSDELAFQQRDLSLIDGRIRIKNQETYDKLFEDFAQSQKHAELWNSDFTRFQQEGFTSMREAYHNFGEEDIQAILNNGGKLFGEYAKYLTIRPGEDGELEALSVIPEPFEARISNSEGLLQIGEDVRRYFYDYYLEVKAASNELIDELKQLEEGEFPAFAEKVDIYRHTVTDLSKSRCGGNTNAKPEYASSPRRRINATLIYKCKSAKGAISQVFYSEVKNQRRNGGIWWARKADRIKSSVTGSSNNEGGWEKGPWEETNRTWEYTVTNEKKLDKIFAYFYSDACYPNIFSVDYSFVGTHELTDKDGRAKGSTSNNRRCD